jgi:rare lipoprotein A
MQHCGATEVRWRPLFAFAEFPLRLLLVKLDVVWLWPQGRTRMQISVRLERVFIGMSLMLFWFVGTARAEMASVYGGRDGYCGSRTANGERVNCSAMTAAHRRLPFGTRVRVCHGRCVTVRINDRGPWVRGRDIDLTPAAARAIGLDGTGRVTLSRL